MKGKALLVAALVLMLSSVLMMGTQQPARAQIAGYSVFPTAEEDDAKMLCVVGRGQETFAFRTIRMWIGVEAGETSFEIGIFDGDTGLPNLADWTQGNWDKGTSQLKYTLYADPMKDGTGTTVVGTWYGNDDNMPNNAWYNIPRDVQPVAQAPNGNYFYRLEVETTDTSTANQDYSCFKLRSSAQASLLPGAFSIQGTLHTMNDLAIIYPSWPDLTNATYDGQWQFYVYCDDPQQTLDFWDGDFDYGDDMGLGGSTVSPDTDDPNTPPTPPSWGGAFAQDEGAQVIGAPPDDNSADIFRVEAPAGHNNVIYQIVDTNDPADWIYYLNDNPSGNSEWEKFVLSTRASASPDHLVAGLPAGYYWWYIQGLDLHNLVALSSECEFFSTENGPPPEPPLEPEEPEPEFVPEPGSLLLLGSGLSALAGFAGLNLRKRGR
jgi:hypothetical protein